MLRQRWERQKFADHLVNEIIPGIQDEELKAKLEVAAEFIRHPSANHSGCRSIWQRSADDFWKSWIAERELE